MRSEPFRTYSPLLEAEAQHVGEHALLDAGVLRVRAGALDAEDGVLGRDLRVRGAQRRVAELGDHELEAEPVVVLEAQAALGAGAAAEALLPEVERRLGGDAELERVDHPDAGAAACRAGELEPGQDRARRALLVAEVEVVRLRRVEVDGLLDEAQPEQIGVEAHVLPGVARDHGDVMEARKVHASSLAHVIACATTLVSGTPATSSC